MEWERISDTGQIWRVRVQLVDRPGTLSALTARLSAHECNLLAVTVLPVSGSDTSEGNVVDDFVLRAPARMTADHLRALVESDSVTCCGLTTGSVNDLVDPETTLLRLTRAALAGTITVAEAIRRLLGADSMEPAARAREQALLDATGHAATITAAGNSTRYTRAWAPYVDGELARVEALLELVAPTQEAPASPATDPERREIPGAEPEAPPATTLATPHVRQLSSLDVQFLNAETASTVIHVGGLTILDPSDLPGGVLTAPALRDVIASRLHLVPPLRWTLRTVPLGIDLPYWDDEQPVDLHYHVRAIDLRHEGNGSTSDGALRDLVARLDATHLDRSKPLWEAYLISGLDGGRQALYTKVHHAVIDGVSGAEVMAAVMDLTPEPFAVPPSTTHGPEYVAPRALRLIGRTARRAATKPARLARAARSIAPHIADVPGIMALPGVDGVARKTRRSTTSTQPERPGAPPMTPFNQRITARRSIATTSIPLADIKTAKNAWGCTVNDIVMAVCTTAIRRWLSDNDALPTKPLVASMPVSVRTPEQHGTAGNQIGFMPTILPTHEPDPARRIAHLTDGIAAAKQRFAHAPATLLHAATEALPQLLHGVASRAVFAAAGIAAPPFNLLISNVPGPQMPLYVAGAKVLHNYPVSVISDFTGGLNITVMSYNGNIDFGLVTCPDLIPALDVLASHLHDAMTEILQLATADASGARVG
ncbi:wax ester/triacylglycerol synthase family O-acyltransferase [Hoyosella sp. G463]|uniref:Diacylglycerol O-acyltransferase n=1 Tax=Lolliginicoccus lacisalsi TaxID=2742202 RepID=A0A927PM66_9ACTN|nr:wax ester/triacylglycerol synthase family O-acyltransferase [Lolliginicoccus lacisalsi]MBD8506107.1 wax ester/triacylglycerol synthase family O-acyltransferase [Lolliginicoccus lacisalsi]